MTEKIDMLPNGLAAEYSRQEQYRRAIRKWGQKKFFDTCAKFRKDVGHEVGVDYSQMTKRERALVAFAIRCAFEYDDEHSGD